MSTDSKIDDYNYQNMFSSTLNSSNISGSYVITNGTGGTTYTYPWNGTGSNTFYTTNHIPTTVITNNDVVVGGKSLKDFMENVEERLLILQPDPAKLEKYAALKKAYEHYKLMEKLVSEE